MVKRCIDTVDWGLNSNTASASGVASVPMPQSTNFRTDRNTKFKDIWQDSIETSDKKHLD